MGDIYCWFAVPLMAFSLVNLQSSPEQKKKKFHLSIFFSLGPCKIHHIASISSGYANLIKPLLSLILQVAHMWTLVPTAFPIL